MSAIDAIPYQPISEPARPNLFKRLLGKAGSRASWMLSDQGIVSVGNFLTTNMLGRHLPQDWQFGAYGIMLETMFFLNSLQAALVDYPLTIQGATGNERGLRRSATAALLFTVMLLPALGLAMGAAAARAGKAAAQADAHQGVVVLAVTAAIAMLIWQMQETLRRGLISEFRISSCIPGDAISYLGQAGVIYILHRMHCLNLTTAFVSIGVTSAAALVLQSFQIGLAPIALRECRDLLVEWWKLSRWMLLTNLSTFVTGLGFWWLLEFTHKADVTVFTAVTQPLKLTTPVLTSIGGLIIPAVARSATSGGARAAARSAFRYAALGGAMLLPIYLFLLILPNLSMHIVYGNRYGEDAPLLRLWVFNMMFTYVGMVLNSWLAGLKQSRYQFLAQVIHMIVIVLITMPATIRWGVTGMILAGLGTTVIDTAALVYFLARAQKELPAPNETPASAVPVTA